ncbi:MAG: response regulator transcription factor [Candidatus Didemnitutus sp.]|nr:response regulator transcription factor [Candidatus Didemnitutus sp.]
MIPTATTSPIRVLLVDDSPIIRLGLRAALEDFAQIAIVGEGGTAAEAVALAQQLRPQVVLLDLRLPDQSGVAACRSIVSANSTSRVLILTSSSNERHVQEALAAGAAGYLLKENDGAALAAAIEQVAAGHSVIDPSLVDQVVRLVRLGSGPDARTRLASLSAQEQKVVALVAAGQTNKEIGQALALTEKTVKNYLARIFEKLGITRRAQLAALYVAADHTAS